LFAFLKNLTYLSTNIGLKWPLTKLFSAWAGEIIDLKRITRCKLALIFTSADHRKFLGLFGSEAARL
jgi:hypothetical protein